MAYCIELTTSIVRPVTSNNKCGREDCGSRNSIAPKFLREESQIEIEIISPTQWRPNAPRLRTTLNEGGRRFSLAFVGSGIARWASYSIRLACQELLNGTIVGDPNTDVLLALEQMSDDDAASYEDTHVPISFDEGSPYEEIAALKILPSQLDVVLLLDEPEAHLHPARSPRSENGY